MGRRHPARFSMTGLLKRRRNCPTSLRRRLVPNWSRAAARSVSSEPVRQHARGFTLTEMLVVIALLAALASMTVPSVMKIHGRRKLTEAAERARAVAASARVHAIESGLVYQFCCEANGSRFAVVPFEPDHTSSGANGQSGGGQMPAVPLLHRLAGHLPKGIVFSSVATGFQGTSTANPSMMPGTQGNLATSHKIQPSVFDGLPNAGELAGVNWSIPILFNSDGSANADVQVVVSDAHSQQITMRIRAFTGAVSMERISVRRHK